MNYSKFREAVAYVGISNREIAKLLGISEQSLYNKATGKTEFKNSEIKLLSQILSLSLDKVNDIFRREVVIYLIRCGYFDFFQ